VPVAHPHRVNWGYFGTLKKLIELSTGRKIADINFKIFNTDSQFSQCTSAHWSISALH